MTGRGLDFGYGIDSLWHRQITLKNGENNSEAAISAPTDSAEEAVSRTLRAHAKAARSIPNGCSSSRIAHPWLALPSRRLPGYAHGEASGWSQLGRSLSGKRRARPERSLFDPPHCDEPNEDEPVLVKLRDIRLERLRGFGDV